MSIFALKCPIFFAGDELKGGFIRPHDLLSYHQHSSEDISKQIGDEYSSNVESGEFWRPYVDLISSGPSLDGAR